MITSADRRDAEPNACTREVVEATAIDPHRTAQQSNPGSCGFFSPLDHATETAWGPNPGLAAAPVVPLCSVRRSGGSKLTLNQSRTSLY